MGAVVDFDDDLREHIRGHIEHLKQQYEDQLRAELATGRCSEGSKKESPVQRAKRLQKVAELQQNQYEQRLRASLCTPAGHLALGLPAAGSVPLQLETQPPTQQQQQQEQQLDSLQVQLHEHAKQLRNDLRFRRKAEAEGVLHRLQQRLENLDFGGLEEADERMIQEELVHYEAQLRSHAVGLGSPSLDNAQKYIEEGWDSGDRLVGLFKDSQEAAVQTNREGVIQGDALEELFQQLEKVDRRLLEIFRACDVGGLGRIKRSDLAGLCAAHPDVARFLGFNERIRRGDVSAKRLDAFLERLGFIGAEDLDWDEFRQLWPQNKLHKPAAGKQSPREMDNAAATLERLEAFVRRKEEQLARKELKLEQERQAERKQELNATRRQEQLEELLREKEHDLLEKKREISQREAQLQKRELQLASNEKNTAIARQKIEETELTLADKVRELADARAKEIATASAKKAAAAAAAAASAGRAQKPGSPGSPGRKVREQEATAKQPWGKSLKQLNMERREQELAAKTPRGKSAKQKQEYA
eukprot:TRINITY_DN5457_c0_g5_i2.p1 TRINITY_DN5457_c0_g5~~TRINITY_DN5457_c0_g5_i2.p1  ORF type:complete len:531 (-),score=185.28 TRINITY_DN5457_c0_g5_i2:1326-2918(-)